MQETHAAGKNANFQCASPFSIEDLEIFDDETLRLILAKRASGITIEKLAHSLQGVNKHLLQRIEQNLSPSLRSTFMYELHNPVSKAYIESDRCIVLDALFWELTYWKTPELYDELIEGEQLHPAIFQQIEPDINDKIVLDVGAGSGRATFECVKYSASKVYAVDPSPGLLRILRQKIDRHAKSCPIIPLRGHFNSLPLPDKSVDTALSCSAFTSDPIQGGEPGLAEFRRVIKPGGKLFIIWPRTEDHEWLNEHNFSYVVIPVNEEMRIHFRTIESALRFVQRFYANNAKAIDYIIRVRSPDIPFSIVDLNPPCDYYWLKM
ncbi:MAG TPA: class I SAM-dependent methyltransferase [Ktedonobacteraceae bacterium]|nr:class I SAM-dependent methyltransferase [Ktedonobacteraceae bacterium]